MHHPEPVARRLFDLTEPISLVNFFSSEPAESMAALGFRGYWDGYFAGRAAPLGRVPAEVVHAAFYNFAEGEVARHVPKVWSTTTPGGGARRARAGLRGCAAQDPRRARRTPGLARAAELLAKASTSAPTEGRVMYAGLRALPVPEEPVARLWHAANLLREHRGDGHIAALVSERIGGTEAHVLVHSTWASTRRSRSAGSTTSRGPGWPRSWTACATAAWSMPPAASPTPGVRPRTRIEALTDALAEAPYDLLEPAELDELIAVLEPISRRLQATGSE